MTARVDHGTWLEAGTCPDPDHEGKPALTISAARDSGYPPLLFCAEPEAFTAALRELHEQAGVPAPVILERPGNPGAAFEFEGITFSVRPGSGVDTTRVSDGIQRGSLHEPGSIRRIAAKLAAMADEAELPEPDPADVEELAAAVSPVIPASTISVNPDAPATIARAALRWWRDKQRRGGEESRG